ncbi:MAG: hypothetical protein WBN69_16265 [Eudoraea sp.]
MSRIREHMAAFASHDRDRLREHPWRYTRCVPVALQLYQLALLSFQQADGRLLGD